MQSRTAAIVPAAGRGVRLGPGVAKALRPLCGVPVLVHSVRSLTEAAGIDLMVVAAPADQLDQVRLLFADQPVDVELSVVAGGQQRQQSVAAALAALPADVDVVLVHDAARPLVPADLVSRVLAAVRAGADAVVPVLPITDSVKEVEASGSAERVQRSVDRESLRAVQTPQGFRREVLARAHAAAADDHMDATDDAGLVERIGVEVVVVPGAQEAFKVTGPLDLVLAEAVLTRRGAAR